MARGDRSAAAYRHVDVTCIPQEHREEILNDAEAGGREFGLCVVEQAHNGPAITNIYGVYKGDAEAAWELTKEEFGFSEENPDVNLTAKAVDDASAAAEAARAAEEAELAKIAGEDKKKK